MNIEEVREYALSLNEQVTEDLFVKSWISWRIAGKWFLLTNLDVPEPHVAVKMLPDVAIDLRERYEGVGPAIHMNKKNWSELYLNQLDDDFVKEQIKASFDLVVSKLPKNALSQLALVRHGYEKFAISPKDISSLAKLFEKSIL